MGDKSRFDNLYSHFSSKSQQLDHIFPSNMQNVLSEILITFFKLRLECQNFSFSP